VKHEPKCAVSPQRPEPEQLRAIDKLRLKDFNPEEGFEWPASAEDRDKDDAWGGGKDS
jgi:hypothetical protein